MGECFVPQGRLKPGIERDETAGGKPAIRENRAGKNRPVDGKSFVPSGGAAVNCQVPFVQT